MTEIKITSLNISEQKGTIKKPVDAVMLTHKGIEGDAHAGTWHRQISLLAEESIEKYTHQTGRAVEVGEFAENITTKGMLLYEAAPFDKFTGCNIQLEVTQIGKKCHGKGCTIYTETGTCVMPKEGIFCRVLKTGKLSVGQTLLYTPKVFTIHVITISDRASRGEYEDLSGPEVERSLQKFFDAEKRQTKFNFAIVPDEIETIQHAVKQASADNADMIICTGGTGIGPRDISPEAIKPLLTKEIPGIMEYIRMKFGQAKPNALVSRSVAGLVDKSLLYLIPGSPRAVREYIGEITPTLWHSLFMVNGIDRH